MRPYSHTQLPNNGLRPFLFLLLYIFGFSGGVAFSEYRFCVLFIAVFSLYGEYAVGFVSSGWCFSTL